MGSSGSKSNAAASESSSDHRRSHSKGSKVFQSSCIGNSRSPGGDSDNDEQVTGHQAKENGSECHCEEETKSDSEQVKADCYRNAEAKPPEEMACVSSNIELDEWGQSSLSNSVSRCRASSSRGLSSRSLNSSSRFLSRFSFLPGNLSFRLSRGTSIGSSRAYAESSTSSSLSNDELRHLHQGSSNDLVRRNKTSQGCDFFPACLINRSSRPQDDDFAAANLDLNPSSSGFSGNLQDSQIVSTQEVARNTENNRVEFGVNLYSRRNTSLSDGIETRLADRTEAREPVERNVRFSRTLSVGRLRDRVLRRSSFPELISCPLQQESEVVNTSEGSRRQGLGSGTGVQASNDNAISLPSSSGYSQSIMSSSLYGRQDFEVETSRAREPRYHDLLENRSNFLERRRRIRSQVRALQRMGSRFENMSGHERSCVFSGQHRTGRCSCRLTTRDSNSNDGTSTRASISRIVLLAEALFEVLDEIHQQSVVLSSRPSLSSIGSVPAPIEVVEALPVKFYCKSQKHLNDEDVQCYICLVEYEDGDSVRVLPCHHEFHKSCVDKWLKEIHRICPLCRGDICRTDSSPAEN